MDIYTVNALLKEIIQKYPNLKLSALKSLNNIYKNISNPPEKYKNKL
jgi:transcriptional antiterminator